MEIFVRHRGEENGKAAAAGHTISCRHVGGNVGGGDSSPILGQAFPHPPAVYGPKTDFLLPSALSGRI